MLELVAVFSWLLQSSPWLLGAALLVRVLTHSREA